MKKFVIFIVLLMFASCFSPALLADTLGDVDADGKVDLTESVYSLQVIAGIRSDIVSPNIIKGHFSKELTGYAGIPAGSSTVTGVGTLFTKETSAGDSVKIEEQIFTIAEIISDTQLVLDTPFNKGTSDSKIYIDGNLLSVQNSNGINKFVIDRSGRVAIGTDKPNARLHINELDKNNWNNLRLTKNETFGGAFLQFFGESSGTILKNDGEGPLRFYTNGLEGIRINGDGNVGIGTTTPNRKLTVNGEAGGKSAWFNDSDALLKKNISTITDALDKVMKLRGVSFEWKDSENYPEGKQIGFIAQEAEDVVPEVISKEGEFYSMQYAPLTALLVEAVKALKAENDELKTIICEDHPDKEICQ